MPPRPLSPRSAELRPLRTAELLDAALEIARRDLGLYGGLAVIALAPLALLSLRLAVARGGGTPLDAAAHAGHAVLLTVALLWRYVVMGASAIALERHLAGETPRLGPVLRAALGRGLSLAVAGALVALINLLLYFIFFANIWLGWFALCAVPLVAERSATGLGSLGASRRVLAGLGGKAAALNALYLLLAVLVMLNFMLGVHVLLVIGHALFDLDVAWTQRFLSPANPVFWLITLGVSLTLLEPLRHLTCALLVWDARIRREAHDIRAVFTELSRATGERGRRAPTEAAGALAGAPGSAPPAAPPPPGPGGAFPPAAPGAPFAPSAPRFPGGGAAALVLLAALGLAAPARASSSDPDRLGERLIALQQRARIMAQPGGLAGRSRDYAGERDVSKLPPVEQEKLARFLEEGEATLNRLQRQPQSDARRREAEQLARRAAEVSGAVERLGAREAPSDVRQVAREVLAQPEFQVKPRRGDEVQKQHEESWFDRLLRRLFKRRSGPRPIAVEGAGLGGGFFQVLTTVLLVAGAALILVLVVQWLFRRKREEDEGPRAPTAGDDDLTGPLPDPTKRTAAEWLADADAAAAAGDFRRAVRALYLALLSALCRRGVLRYDPARTNGEYTRMFRGSGDDRAVFRHVTLMSDAAIYGDFAPGADDYGLARSQAIRLAAEEPQP